MQQTHTHTHTQNRNTYTIYKHSARERETDRQTDRQHCRTSSKTKERNIISVPLYNLIYVPVYYVHIVHEGETYVHLIFLIQQLFYCLPQNSMMCQPLQLNVYISTSATRQIFLQTTLCFKRLRNTFRMCIEHCSLHFCTKAFAKRIISSRVLSMLIPSFTRKSTNSSEKTK